MTMAVDILNLGFKVDTAQVKNASKDLDSLSKSAKNSGASLGEFGNQADKAAKNTNGFGSALKGLAIAGTAYAIASMVKEMATLSTRYSELGIVMNVVGKNAGYTNKELAAQDEALKKTGISMIESRASIAKLISAHINLANATKLARIAQDAAVIGGMNSSEAFASLVSGIQTAQVETLRTLGINVNFEKSYAQLAITLHKTATDLTEVEKTQARVNAVLAVAPDIAGAYESAMTNAGKQIRSSTRYVEDLKVKLGGVFDEALITSVMLFTSSIKDANGELDVMKEKGQLDNWSNDLLTAFEYIAVAGANTYYVLHTIGNELGGFAARLDALSRGGFVSMYSIGAQVEKDSAAAKVEIDKLTESILKRREASKPAPAENEAETKRNGILREQERIEQENADARAKAAEELAKQIKTHTEATLKSIATLNIENSLLAQNVPLQDAKTIAQLKANGATDEMIVAMLNANSANEALTKSLKETEDFYSNFDKSIISATNAYADLVEGLDKAIQAQKDENDVSRGLARSVEDLSIARLEERKVILDGLGLATADLEREIELRKQLSSEMEYKKVLAAEKKASDDKIAEAEKAADDLKKINDKVAEDFNKSLTDAIFRGFESGKSFAKTFKDSLVNSFKTLILRPIVSFIVDSSGIAQVMGAITAGLSGQAVAGSVGAAGGAAGGGMGLGLAGASSSIFNAVTKGFDTANIAFEQSIQQFGSWIANFSDGTGALADIGGAIGEYSSEISQALPYAGSVIKLLQGDFVGAAFTAAGTAIGSALGGPIGGAIGSFIGGTVGGLFGGGAKTYQSQVKSSFTNGQFTSNKATGAGSRLLKGADQPLTELSQAFATTLGGLFKAANLDVDMELSTQIGKKKRSWASFTATIGDEVFKTVVGANKGGLEKTLQTLVGKTFSDVMIKAIQASDLQAGIKDLFDGLTDKDQIAQMSQAAQSLMKEFGSMAGQVAQVAVEATDSTASLLEFINAIGGVKSNVSDVMYSLMTPVEQASKMLTELGTIFGSLNLTVPTSVADLQALAKSIDYTTKSGLSLAAALPQLVAVYTAAQQAAEQVVANAKANTANARQALVEAFNIERDRLQNIVDNVKESESALRNAFDAKALGIQDTITKFKNFGDSIRAFRLSLGERVASNSNPLLAVRTRFDAVSALALSGNEEALGSIQDASNDYLSAFEQYSGSFIDYQRAFANVSETLLAVENSSFSTASVAQLQLDSLKTQVGSLISLNDTAKTIEQLMGEFNLAQALSTSAQVQLTALNSQQISLLGSIDGGIVNLVTTLASYQSAISAELSAVGSLNAAKASAVAAAESVIAANKDKALTEAEASAAAPEKAKRDADILAGKKAIDAIANVTTSAVNKLTDETILKLADALTATDVKYDVQKGVLAKTDVVNALSSLLGISATELNKISADGLKSIAGASGFNEKIIDSAFAQGGVFTNGIVDSPTAFNIGTMGEAGSEAIMPLTNINGSLGVTTNNSEMVKQLTIISEKISRLESAQIATVQNTGKVARIIERADNGDSLNVMVVT